MQRPERPCFTPRRWRPRGPNTRHPMDQQQIAKKQVRSCASNLFKHAKSDTLLGLPCLPVGHSVRVTPCCRGMNLPRPPARAAHTYQFLWCVAWTDDSYWHSPTLTIAPCPTPHPICGTLRKDSTSQLCPRARRHFGACPGGFAPTVAGPRHARSRRTAMTEHRV